MSLLISTNHLPPKTALQVSPVLGTLAVTWLGRLKNRMEEAERSPQRSAALHHPAFLADGHLASHAQPCASSLLPALGWKTPSGILRGRRDLDARLSTLQLSNPSAATGTPCTRSRGTGRTQRLWTRAAPCEEGHALPASPCIATRPLTDGLH